MRAPFKMEAFEPSDGPRTTSLTQPRNMRMQLSRIAAIGFCVALVLPACRMSRTAKGGMIGAGAGAGVGAVIGNQFGSDGTAVGAIIGAAVGGTAGALIGRHMDKQAEELRNDLEGATVTRVGEGIKITFDSGLLFGVDQSSLNPTSQSNLNDLAATLKKYDDTDILVEGHTDSDGAEAHNQTLSERRANSVKAYLVSQGVASNRFTTTGYGELQPVADNSTASGKASNRRVEIAIYANKRMKKAAEKGQL
jgi:outer membrane protein OmpA-like peptidoglycan-associated protein